MGASPSARPSVPFAEPGIGPSDSIDRQIDTARTALERLRDTVADRHPSDLREALHTYTESAGATLHTANAFIASAPSLRSITNFRRGYQAAVERVTEIATGLPEHVVQRLSPSDHVRITEQFRPLRELAEHLHHTLYRSHNDLITLVTRNQESDFIQAGLRSIETTVLADLHRTLGAIRMLGETRTQIVAHFKDHYLLPFIEGIQRDPLNGRANHDALTTAQEQLARDERINLGPGQMVLLGKNFGTPRILRGLRSATERLALEVDTLNASSLARPELDSHVRALLQPTTRTLATGLRYTVDFSWSPDPAQESCVVTLASPWGDRGSYRYSLHPRSGEEVRFRREVASILHDIERLADSLTVERLSESIAHRLNGLSKGPIIEVAPFMEVGAFLQADSYDGSAAPKDDTHAAILRTLQQRFTLTPLPFGSEGADFGRINRIGIEIVRGTTFVRLFREGYNGTRFDSTPTIVLTTNDTLGAQTALRAALGTLRVVQGDIGSDAGQAALTTLLSAHSSPHLGERPVFDVAQIANLTLTHARDLTVRLAPSAEVTNLVLRDCAVNLTNTSGEQGRTATIANIAADERSTVRLELAGAHLERMNLANAILRCRNCTADRVSITRLTLDSAQAWRMLGNRFLDPRTNSLDRSFGDRLLSLFGSEPTYSMHSRNR